MSDTRSEAVRYFDQFALDFNSHTQRYEKLLENNSVLEHIQCYDKTAEEGRVLCIDQETFDAEWDRITDDIRENDKSYRAVIAVKYWADMIGQPGVYYADQSQHYQHRIEFDSEYAFQAFEPELQSKSWALFTVQKQGYREITYDGKLVYQLILSSAIPFSEELKERLMSYSGVIRTMYYSGSSHTRLLFDLPRL